MIASLAKPPVAEYQWCEGGMLDFSDTLLVCTFLHGFVLSVTGRHPGLSVDMGHVG